MKKINIQFNKKEDFVNFFSTNKDPFLIKNSLTPVENILKNNGFRVKTIFRDEEGLTYTLIIIPIRFKKGTGKRFNSDEAIIEVDEFLSEQLKFDCIVYKSIFNNLNI